MKLSDSIPAIDFSDPSFLIKYIDRLSALNKATIVYSLTGAIIEWDQECEKLLGVSAEEAKKNNISSYMPQADFAEMFSHKIAEVSLGKTFYTHNANMIDHESRILSVSLISRPYVQNNQIIGVVEDIIKTTEITKFKDLCILSLEYSQTGKVLVNSNGVIIIANQQIEKMFGYKRREILGQKVEMLLPERYRHMHVQFREQFVKHPMIRQMGVGRDLFALSKDGREIPVEIGLAGASTTEDVFVLASIIDITERKKMEEFARSNKDLEEFAYIASHDLQAPLRHINFYVQFLVEKYGKENDEETKKWVRSIQDCACHMSHLIRDLLEFSRVSKGNMVLEQVDFNAVFQQVLTLLDEQIQQKHAIIKVENLPSLLSSSLHIQQLFQNLIENALNFSKTDETPFIHVSASKQAGLWEFIIEDNGIGIDSKYYDKIFGVFQQLTPKCNVSGTGIGLAICKKIVGLLGGKIWVESKPGEGSRFYFTIKEQMYG